MEEPYADEFGDDDELFEEILAEGAASEIPASRDAGAEAEAGSAGSVQPEGNAEHTGTTNLNQADKGKGPHRGIPAAYYEELSTAGTVEERPKPSSRGGAVSSDRGGRAGRGGHGVAGPQPAAGGRGLGPVVGPRGPSSCIRPMLSAGPVPGALRPPPGMPHLPNGMLVPLHMQMQMQARPMGPMGLMGPAVAPPQLMMHGSSGSVAGRGGREVRPRCQGFGGSGGPGAVMMLQGLAAAAAAAGRLGQTRTPLMPPPPPPPGAARVMGARGRGGPRGPPIGLPGRPPGPPPGHGGGPRQALLVATGGGVGGAIPAMNLLRQQMLQAVATGAASGPMLANMAAAGLANPAIAYMIRALQQQQQQQQRQQQEQQPSQPQQQAADGDLAKVGMRDLGNGLSEATAPAAEATRLGQPEDAEDQAGIERMPGSGGLGLDMPSIFPAELLEVGGGAPRQSGGDDEGPGAADGGSSGGGSGSGIGFPRHDLGGQQQPLSPPPSLRQVKHPENLPPHLRASAFGHGPHVQQQHEAQQYRNQPNYRHPLQQQPINQKRIGDEKGDAAGWESEAQQLQQPPHKRQMILNPPALRVNGQLQGSHLQARRQLSFYQEQQQLLNIPSAFAGGQAGNAEANAQFADDDGGSDLGHQSVKSPSQHPPQRQELCLHPANHANGRSSSDVVDEGGPASVWAEPRNEPWAWRRWSGEVELVGGSGEADGGDTTEADLSAEGLLRRTEGLLADAALADPLNPGQTTTAAAAAAGWESRRPRAGQGPRSGAFWPEPLDVAVLGPARPEAMGALSPTSAPRPAARFGAPSHKWVREGTGAGPSTASAVGASTTPAAITPASDTAQPAALPPPARTASLTAAGTGTAAATALPPSSAVNSEVLKKTEDAIALMKRVIALEEARLKQQQQLKRKKATGTVKTAKPTAGASASAGVAATSSPSITAAGSAREIGESPSPSGKRQRGDSTGNGQPAKATAARIDARRGLGARQAAPAHATPSAQSHNSIPLNSTAHGSTQEDFLEAYAFEDDGTGLYDEAYEQHHQHTGQAGAAGAGVDAIVAGQVGANTRTAVAGPGSAAAAAGLAAAAAVDVHKSGNGGGIQLNAQSQLAERQAAFDEADVGVYDDEDLLLSDDLPAELDADEQDGEMRLGMTGPGTAGSGIQAGGAISMSVGAAATAAAAKRGRDSGLEGDVQQLPAVQRQRIS
ncbi:hypothetical protein Vretimale_1653 [Volvox reticuliferus]|uniref:Uncharacterized protein n=1 Tax=Volvox reticuliferus TaxID=1737510 RepID=A0A8J4CRY7_9CHLO|nr:hypothetical protein Vretifemale_15541 [Volvox reticuliferus]GIL95676.1 hypothetical protein Vretimale_1653 [Volvox reticuliferus]